ncbi:MAG TPA: protein phosphatase 2C domain-containing protein [Ktedonosporobacter sp.]|nr:protein phosphatase 2C domain-containing protein [Ktedonosporobacter sp.]
MLGEFKRGYYLSYWLRATTWLGLFCVFLLFWWTEGGMPPLAWRWLVLLLDRFPQLWSIRGPVVLVSLAGLMLLSLFWLCAWGAFAWVGVRLARYHWKIYRIWRQRPAQEWFPDAQRAALAVWSPGGHTIMGETLAYSMPRIRLPQKVQLAPPDTAGRTEALRHSGQSGVTERLTARAVAIEEVPTRPALPPAAGSSRQPSLRPLEVGVGWHTGIARRRNPNEDSLVVLQGTCTYQEQLVPFGLFVVADGMGGHDCGLEASQIAMQSMMQTVLPKIVIGDELSDEFLSDMLIGGVERANRAIYQRSREWEKDMGTTLTAALIVGSRVYVVNVGDSRTYIYRDGDGLLQMTRDHSVVARLAAMGKIAPEEIYTHPDRNQVYRSLGNEERVDVDWFISDLYSHDRLLLCSDGLWEMVRDPEMARILKSAGDPMRAGDMLVQAALRGGGTDNVSVIVVAVP